MTASRTFTATDALGKWQFYATVADRYGTWRDGPGVFATLGVAQVAKLERQSFTMTPASLASGSVTATAVYTNTGTAPYSFQRLALHRDEARRVRDGLADTFAHDDYVLFGLVNEPQSNSNGAQDAACWTAMNNTVKAIRAVEDGNDDVSHPIPSDNIAYETHVYDPTSSFATLFEHPQKTLPVIIGEFGPAGGMSLTDTANLMARAEALKVPYLAWTFHMRCPPNLLVDNSSGGCGVNMPLQPTSWGQQLKTRLSKPALP